MRSVRHIPMGYMELTGVDCCAIVKSVECTL